MNEQIEKIYGEACIHYGYLDEREFLEKFAELIVRECLYIVEGEDDGSADTKSVRMVMIRMKEHFGVEE